MRRIEGFTLWELVMVIVILGILGAFVGPVAYNAIRSYDAVQKSTNTNAKIRYAMERIAREMRDVRRQVTDAAALDIPSMTATSMAFFKTDGTRVVLYGVSGGVNLAYSIVANPAFSTLTGMLVDQVQAGSFSLGYVEQGGTTVAGSASSIVFVQVSMTLTEGAVTVPARLRVDLRNPQ
jgi:prepilin-type N-terminal cleavage/methylation domain-containing protein